MRLPPGPEQHPYLQILQCVLRPLSVLDACAQRFGDTFTLRLPHLGNAVILSRPEHIKQVLTGDADVFLAGKAKDTLRPILGSHSILLLDGKEHMRQRRLLMPPFYGERMHTYAEMIRDITEAEIARMPLRQPFSIYPHMQSITLSVILRAVFGFDEGANMSRLVEIFVAATRAPTALFAILPAAQVDLPLSPYRSFLRRKAEVDREVYALIEERRRSKYLAERTDILSLMLGVKDEEGNPMTDEEIHDELMTMLAAGHETTATALAWAFERILAEPRVARKLFAEVDSVVERNRLDPAAAPRLEYLDAVIKETLRLRPIVPNLVRELAKPVELAGYDLPAGTKVVPCVYLTHRRSDVYPDPTRFYPERFLGVKIDPYAWFPFGGGVRRCLGMAFALYEMKIILATVFAKAHLLAEGKPERIVRRGPTFAPSGGGRVVLSEVSDTGLT